MNLSDLICDLPLADADAASLLGGLTKRCVPTLGGGTVCTIQADNGKTYTLVYDSDGNVVK